MSPAEDAAVVQLLTPEGELLEDPDFPLAVTEADLRGMYRAMLLARRLDTEATALQRQGELGLWAPLVGQEATQVGTAWAMADGDRAFPTYREHAVALVRGVTPLQILRLFRGNSHGGWDPQATGVGLYTLVVGAQSLHAVGYAMGIGLDAARSHREAPGQAAIGFFGDGASSQGDVHEACVFAAVFNAPVLLVCTNNQWAISEPVERQARVPLVRRAQGYGFPGVAVDGNDVLGVLAVARAGLDRARDGGGPTLVEARTYRMGAHTTSDDPTRYRLDADVERWKLRDPLARLRAFLTRQQVVDGDFFTAVEAEADAFAAELREGIRSMPDPDPAVMFAHAYAGEYPLVTAQAAWHADYQASFLDPAQASR
jgi:pyruvate dehydrogenase E1 component alpha subunit